MCSAMESLARRLLCPGHDLARDGILSVWMMKRYRELHRTLEAEMVQADVLFLIAFITPRTVEGQTQG